MDHRVSPQEAQTALATVEHSRRRVVDEIDLPRWYWYGLAVGWVALGVLADLKHPIVTAVATLVFGTTHASVAPHVIDGRHRTRRLSVHAELVTRRLPMLVIGSLIVLAALTVAGSLLAAADGARHPVTVTSVVVAVVIVLGGPALLAALRRRTTRRLTAG